MHALRVLWTVGVSLMLRQWLAEAETVVEEVPLGGSAILECDITYHSDTTWLRYRAHSPPQVLVQSSLSDNRILYRHRPFPRLQIEVKNRCLALRIDGVGQSDEGLYYCMGTQDKVLVVGKGMELKVSGLDTVKPGVKSANQTQVDDFASSAEVPGPAAPSFPHLCAVLVGVGVAGMTLAVIVTHLRARKIERGR